MSLGWAFLFLISVHPESDVLDPIPPAREVSGIDAGGCLDLQASSGGAMKRLRCSKAMGESSTFLRPLKKRQ